MRLCFWADAANEGGGAEPRRQRVDRLLRQTLAPLLQLPADALQFGREAHGRPFLRHADAPDFNLTDTRGGTLIGIAPRGQLGVDMERNARQPPVQRLARRWFSAAESEQLQALPAGAAALAFLRLWTAKEASCKATGTGIFGYLHKWQFALEPDQPRLVAAPGAAGDPSRWQFQRFSPTPELTAVLALQDMTPQVHAVFSMLD